MIQFELTVDCSRSGLMISGYSAPGDGFHAVHAADREGRPIVPSTALRGALRGTLEALLRGAGQPVCDSGHNRRPDGCDQGAAGQPCLACQIFGSAGTHVAAHKRVFSALVLGDAVLQQGAHPVISLRHSVGMARRTRSAEPDRLFNRLGPAPGQRLVFKAQGRLIDVETVDAPAAAEQRWRALTAAVRMTQHIGAGRSRGLGRVDLALARIEQPAAAVTADEALLGGDLRVRVRLLAPASIGQPMPRDDQRYTRLEIPGAALRGAVGFGLAEVLKNADDPTFQKLVAEPDGAIFDFLYPVSEDLYPTDQPGQLAAAYPRTARTCKHTPYENRDQAGHGLHDALLDLLAVELAIQDGRRLDDIQPDHCPRCDRPTRPITDKWRQIDAPPRTRLVTRVHLDRRTGSAADQDLFTQVLIEADQIFEGSVRQIPPEGRAHLLRALRDLPLSLGRGRFRGWGRVQVQILPALELAPLKQRIAAFDEALKAHLRALCAPVNLPRLIVLTLLSPLLIQPEADEQALIATALQVRAMDLPIIHRSRRFAFERGWAQRQQGPHKAGARGAHHSVMAGGVYVVALQDPAQWPAIQARLSQLEHDGIGEQRRLGFGRVLAFDPFIVAHRPQRSKNPPAHRNV